MTSDGGAAYTTFPCNGCISVNQVDNVMANGCTALGMKMVVPRTQAHWSSMFSLVTNVLGSSLSNYFQTIPGKIIYPNLVDGRLIMVIHGTLTLSI